MRTVNPNDVVIAVAGFFFVAYLFAFRPTWKGVKIWMFDLAVLALLVVADSLLFTFAIVKYKPKHEIETLSELAISPFCVPSEIAIVAILFISSVLRYRTFRRPS